MSSTQVIDALRALDEHEIRGRIFELAGDGPDPGQPYDYQRHGINKIEQGESASPPVSGILHYPTGAGKTRVGMELIARTLARDPAHRFVWATDRKALIRQSMTRMAELARLFPAGTRFVWADGASELKSGHDAHVVFTTRRTLTDALWQASDGRTAHAWKTLLAEGGALTLVYDECHQLGAPQLQESWRRFYEAVVVPRKARWRAIGLSATPVPTAESSHALLRQYVFPQRPKDAPLTAHDWPFHFFHRVRQETLISSGVLCPINQFLDRGDFDFPETLLRTVVGEAGLVPPGPGASAADVREYAYKFNKSVLSDARVLEHLADGLGRSIATLGKTIVFVPTIDSANRLVALLHERYPALRGGVAAVHSRMNELMLPEQRGETVHRVLDRFRRLGARPSILVNVEMLTEGFDDPKIRTVVLARFTASTNRFWQMIGRGTRGPAAGGTPDCYVIDPIKLVRLYDYFSGYQPSFTRRVEVELEEVEEDEGGTGAIPPEIPAICLPPDPHERVYEVAPELQAVHAQAAAALRDFLAGASLSEAQAIEIARCMSISLAGGAPMLVPGGAAFSSETAAAIVLGELSSLTERAGKDLSWFRRRLPAVADDLDEQWLREQLRTIRAIEQLGLWRELDFTRAEANGELGEARQREATAPSRVSSEEAARPDVGLRFDLVEQAVIDVSLTFARVDGQIHEAEVAIIVESLRRMFGRLPSDEVRDAVRRCQVADVIDLVRLRGLLAPMYRQRLVLQLAELAGADGVISLRERNLLHGLARDLDVPDGFVASVLGAAASASDSSTAAGGGACSSCAFALPPGAAFCPSCGINLMTEGLGGSHG